MPHEIDHAVLTAGREGRGTWLLMRDVSDELLPPDRRLTRDQRGKVLVSDLARQQQQQQDTEAEGGTKTALRPVGRRNHPFAYPDPVKRKVSSRRQKAP